MAQIAPHRIAPSRPATTTGAFTALRDIRVVTQRNIKRIIRTPELLYFATIQPIVFMLLFRYVFGGAIHTPGLTYSNYLMPGLLVESTLFGATTAVALAGDLSSGLVDRFRSLPISRSAVLVGRTLADFCRSVGVVAVVIAVGSLVGFRFNNGVGGAFAAIGIVLVFSYAFSWILVLIGLFAKDAETAQLASLIPVLIFIFASSLAVPIATMPGWLQPFASNQPVSVTMSAVRALTQGGPAWHWAWQSLAWSAGIIIVLVPASITAYRRH